MGGVAVGFFTPAMIARDVPAFCARVECALDASSRGFPMSIEQVKDPRSLEEGRADDSRLLSPLSCIVISGAVPIHIDKPSKNEREGGAFWFVMGTKNRPCLLAAPATRDASQAILDVDNKKGFGFGALELRAGMACHFDGTRQWTAITGLPTGDLHPGEPVAIVLQVPWPHPQEIQRAISIARQGLQADERFSDLVRP